MITEKANRISREIHELVHDPENKLLVSNKSRLLVNELKANCSPTREEFSELVNRSILSAETLWDFIMWIPIWSANEIDKELGFDPETDN